MVSFFGRKITRVALVTGASRGLGAEIAKALAVDNWAVAVNYSGDSARANTVVDAIHRSGGRAAAARFDVRDAGAIAAGLAGVAETLGPVDLLVNNATGPQPANPIMRQSWQSHLDQLEFFVKAPLLLLQALLPDWRDRGRGRVINIGSEAAETGDPNFGDYIAAKSAMLGMTRSWANELGPEGITVNLVAPGWVPVERHAGTPQEALDGYSRRVPLRRMGQPADVAAMVAFLASEKANFLTGQRFAVNGGRTLA